MILCIPSGTKTLSARHPLLRGEPLDATFPRDRRLCLYLSGLPVVLYVAISLLALDVIGLLS